MDIAQWELDPYEIAARAVCAGLNLNPDEPTQLGLDEVRPRWVAYAVEMHKLRLVLFALEAYGPRGGV